MRFKKCFPCFLAVFFLLLSLTPAVKAITADEIMAQIAQLQAQIQALQQQLFQLEAQPWCHNFNVKLGYANRGDEVKQLQTALQKQGFYNGAIDGIYGDSVASAVTGFQQKYQSNILAPWGLKYGTGYAGRTTIAKLNTLYGCSVVQQPQPQPDKPYVKVISPNGGEQWEIGNIYSIKWNVPDVTRVSIYILDQSTGKVATVSPGIVAVLSNTGSYQWKIPSAMPAGNYKVRVLGCPESFSNTGCANVGMSNAYGYDESDNYFSIVGAVSSEPVYYCADTDGGKNINSQGTITGNNYSTFDADELAHGQGTGTMKTFTEYCKNSNTLKEFYCVKAGVSSPLSLGTEIVAVDINCASGCQNGVCLESVCSDSDNGRDYFSQGTVIDGGESYTDYCKNSVTLTEYFCLSKSSLLGLGGAAVDYYGCPYGCQNSTCKRGITVTYPNGGETLMAGGSFDIRWTSQGVDKVKISACADTPLLSTKYSCWELPGTGAGINASVGQYSWTIDENAIYVPGSIKIRVEDFEDESIYDESNDYFNLKGAITILSPNGGEQWTFDQPQTITWQSSGITSATIYLWFPDGGTCKLADVFAPNGQYSITLQNNQLCSNIPTRITAGQYKIKIWSTDGPSADMASPNDASDDYFSIGEAITVISPNGGEQWTKGERYPIRWTSETESARVVIDLYNTQGKNIATGLNAVIDNNESINWAIPTDIATGQYKIQVSICPISLSNTACANVSLRQYGYDQSDSYFSIIE